MSVQSSSSEMSKSKASSRSQTPSPRARAMIAKTPTDKMQEVWFVFKLMEGFVGLICMGFHITGFMNEREPLPHHMYFCGTFFGFTIISVFGNVGACLGSTQTILLEAVVAIVGFLFYMVSSVFSMYHAEKDFHLMYLSDHEESQHPFFFLSKGQSVAALICGVLYLLHAVFALDAICITEESLEGSSVDTMDESVQPIRLYVVWEPALQKLAKTPCGRRIFRSQVRKGLAKNV